MLFAGDTRTTEIKTAEVKTVGILGAGQLARMLGEAASKIGVRVHIFAPEKDAPAFETSELHTHAAYEDEEALRRFVCAVDVLTYEFENIPTQALAVAMREGVDIAPNVSALRTIQDRLLEKQFLQSLDIPCARFECVASWEELEKACHTIGFPCILKTRRFGYDGKGQRRLNTQDDIENPDLKALLKGPCILEGVVPFSCELALIVARSRNGSVVFYDLTRTHHRNHILHKTWTPCGLLGESCRALNEKAQAIALKILKTFDYVGVMGIEFFMREGENGPELLVNELAPRVHNSGHWTQDGCLTSQFEQHIRAVLGWPLGSTERIVPGITMTNLLGDDIKSALQLSRQKDSSLHVYGKRETREGRKMGHVNTIYLDKDAYQKEFF